MTRVAPVKTQDRASGVDRVLDLLQLPPIPDQNVFLKPNFGSAGPPPGSPHQRLMIAEINAAYPTHRVIMDAMEAFVKGGPDTGKRVEQGVVLAAMNSPTNCETFYLGGSPCSRTRLCS